MGLRCDSVLKNCFLALVVFFMFCCEEKESITDIGAPEIKGIKLIDTAFLNTQYKFQKDAFDVKRGCIVVKATGEVNTALPGTYTVNYNYTDDKGNKAATVNGTVCVVENSTGFLSGTYKVECNCVSQSLHTSKQVAFSDTYTTTILPFPEKNRFEIMALNIGAEKVIPLTSLIGDDIKVEIYNYPGSVSTGTLSKSKNSFTIESEVRQIATEKIYQCKNIFNKQLIEK